MFCQAVLNDIIRSACFANRALWKQASFHGKVHPKPHSVKRQQQSRWLSIPVTLAHEPYASIQPWLPMIPPSPEPGPTNARRWTDIVLNGDSKPVIVDVRSPAEFALDHIPGAINLPVLDNKERAIVGRLYSQGDVLRARMEGAALVCANISQMLSQLCRDRYSDVPSDATNPDAHTPLERLRSNPSLLIYCWRGGQRSNALATILSEIRFPAPVYLLVGGYRSWRRLLLRQLDAWPRWKMPGQFWVITGLTGSGKSLVLQELARINEVVLDLEKLADHRGSLFGANLTKMDDALSSGGINSSTEIISQRQFETRLHDLLTTDPRWIDSSQTIWIECESRSVGPHCRLNDSLWTRLRATDDRWGAFRVWLEVPEEARIDWIMRTYSSFIADRAALESILLLLSRYHSAKRIAQWRSFADRDDYGSLVQGLLRHHYDPLYEKSRASVMKEAAKHHLVHSIHLPTVDVHTVRNSLIPQLLDLAHAAHPRQDSNSVG